MSKYASILFEFNAKINTSYVWEIEPIAWIFLISEFHRYTHVLFPVVIIIFDMKSLLSSKADKLTFRIYLIECLCTGVSNNGFHLRPSDL